MQEKMVELLQLEARCQSRLGQRRRTIFSYQVSKHKLLALHKLWISHNLVSVQLILRRLSQSEKSDEMHVAWTELAQTWPRPSLRSQQWLRAKWKQLRSTIEDHLNLSFKGYLHSPPDEAWFANVLWFHPLEICCRLIKELSESGVRLVNLTTSSKSGLEIVSDAYSGTDNSELSQSLTGALLAYLFSVAVNWFLLLKMCCR